MALERPLHLQRMQHYECDPDEQRKMLTRCSVHGGTADAVIFRHDHSPSKRKEGETDQEGAREGADLLAVLSSGADIEEDELSIRVMGLEYAQLLGDGTCSGSGVVANRRMNHDMKRAYTLPCHRPCD